MECSECGAGLAIPQDAIRGEVVTCKDCSTSYELVKESGSTLFSIRAAQIEEEDWGE